MGNPPPTYVEMRNDRSGRARAYVIGSRVRVQDIVLYHERFGQSADDIARGLPHLTLAQVHGALAYYFEDREAIWKAIREDEAFAESMRPPAPTIGSPSQELTTDVAGPAVPS